MKWLMIAVLSMPLFATEKIHYFNLLVERQADGILVKTQPEALLPYDILNSEDYNLRKPTYENMLDAPFRQTAFLMRTLERNRGTIFGERSEPLPIISYRFECAVRDVNGEILELLEYKVTVNLDKEKGKGLLTTADGLKHSFDINRLTTPSEYQKYINNLVFPFVEKKMVLPSKDEFIVDLYYKWPRVEVNKDDFNVFDLFPSTILWNKGIILKIKIHLGTTYVYKKDDQWLQERSQFLRTFSDAIQLYGQGLKSLAEEDSEKAIEILESYVGTVPSDRKALKRLMDEYLKYEMEPEAFSLITRFQPFFATIKDGLANQKDLQAKAERQRNWLLGRKSFFERDRSALVKITSPENEDLVTGTTSLEFTVANDKSPVLVVECYLDEQLIARMDEPPFKVPFNVDGSVKEVTLRVTTYFENETFQEDKIKVRTLDVDQEQLVNLVPLRVSVLQLRGKQAGIERTINDFEIVENDKKREIQHFRKSTAPLRIALVIDTSISMFGKKLYHAQYAVKTFLSKLDHEDRASVFCFDSKVLQINDFTNQYDDLVPELMTVSPQGATSLYDAMLIANDALMGQNGTKVMIVVSDGDDSSSSTTDIHVAGMLRRSPVMVYSIILPGGVLSSNGEGERFLREMARMTGSIHTRVTKTDNLSRTFDRIYQDLKSFYYMDFYSEASSPDKRDIKVRTKSGGNRLRFRTLN